MRGTKAVTGVFTYHDDVLRAIGAAKEKNLDFEVYSPVPTAGILEATMPPKSPSRIFSLIGALLGFVAGWALPILCSLDWPIRVSAKDIVSLPAFFVIGYECTILFGAIFTLLSIVVLCRVPDVFRQVGYDPRFSGDKFGVVVGCDTNALDTVRDMLQGAGADEVQVRDSL